VTFETLDISFEGVPTDDAERKSFEALYRMHPKAPRPPAVGNLLDLLSPPMQALSGHTFLPQNQSLPELGDQNAVTAANCWGTAYEVIRLASGGDPPPAAAAPATAAPPLPPQAAGHSVPSARPDLEFVVFYTDRFQAGRVLRHEAFSERVGTPREFRKGDVPNEVSHELFPRSPGDVLLVITDFPLEDGTTLKVLEHAAVYIDDNVYFEKANAGPNDPYRIATFADVVGTYVASRPATRLEYRRYGGPGKTALPHPVAAFGDPVLVSLEEKYANAIPEELAQTVRANQEFRGADGKRYQAWSAFFPIKIRWSAQKGRWELTEEAYDKSTFRFGKNP
jgi:hypothetical protein